MAGQGPTVTATAIPGLLIVELDVRKDDRGWFTENWQRDKMTRGGLPEFRPVQHNVAHNARTGVTRGLHAEPWNKLVSVVAGRAFCAWVDLREGDSFGTTLTLEVGPGTAVMVPSGVANGYQCLEDETLYSYLVDDHWSEEAVAHYRYVNVGDPTLGIGWPIALEHAVLSDADRSHPPLATARPATPARTVVLGAGGQLGRVLARRLPEAILLNRGELDLTSPDAIESFDFAGVDTIINTSAFTAVDAAETFSGRRDAWALNVTGLAQLVHVAQQRGIRLVHVSSDYVFDGTQEIHDEAERPSPLGVYGQTKAAGDALVSRLPRHFLLRTSWLIGDGANFARTMVGLARSGAKPKVVNDQFGRLTFSEDLASAILHLLGTNAPSGTYNVTNSGPVQSWAGIAGDIFELCGRPRSDVTGITTDEWAADRGENPVAPRPRHSTLALDRITAAGFDPPEVSRRLAEWLAANHPAGR